jgi:hypothetical protein
MSKTALAIYSTMERVLTTNDRIFSTTYPTILSNKSILILHQLGLLLTPHRNNTQQVFYA